MHVFFRFDVIGARVARAKNNAGRRREVRRRARSGWKGCWGHRARVSRAAPRAAAPDCGQRPAHTAIGQRRLPATSGHRPNDVPPRVRARSAPFRRNEPREAAGARGLSIPMSLTCRSTPCAIRLIWSANNATVALKHLKVRQRRTVPGIARGGKHPRRHRRHRAKLYPRSRLWRGTLPSFKSDVE